MKTSLVKVGRSYFVYIPDSLWKKSGLPESGYVELTAERGKIIIGAPRKKSREIANS